MTETDTSIEELRTSHRRDYDVYSTATIQQHLDDIADRRENLPLSYTPGGGFWLATTYDDIAALLRMNNRGVQSFPNMPDGTQAFGQKRQIPIELDGDIHRQYRQLLDPLFAPSRVNLMEEQVRQVAQDLVANFASKGEVDLVPEFAFPFPGSVFLSIMGWPIEDADRMNHWVDVFLHGVPGATEEEVGAARMEAAVSSSEYILGIVADRRANPTDDITTLIVNAEIDGAPIPDEDLNDLFLLLMMAGLDTTASVIAQSMAYFATHPEKWDEMFEDPETIDAAVEELLRWCSPAVPTRNVNVDQVEVGGLSFPLGERIHVPLGAANRDPKYYPSPDEIQFDREPKPHLTFSLGAHRCLGLHLARRELKVAFEVLREVMPSFRLAEGCTPHEHLALTWGVSDVRLVFDPVTAP